MALFSDSCPICDCDSKFIPTNKDGENVDCPRCGLYFITRSALANIKNSRLSERQVANFSGWLRENPEIIVNTQNLDMLLALKTPKVSERAEKLMIAIEKNSMLIGDYVGISYSNTANSWLSVSWSENSDELTYLIDKYLLQEQHWILDTKTYSLDANISVQLTPSGYAYLDQLRQGKGDGAQGFCAMWFDKSVLPIWTEAISPAIVDAGYRPIKINEVNHNNRIDDEILSQIRRSRFVIADFTGKRGGVYFEAGFALGLGITVIWTVRDVDLKGIHFDNRQYNFIQWNLNDLPSFKKALQNRIEATLGVGPLVNR